MIAELNSISSLVVNFISVVVIIATALFQYYRFRKKIKKNEKELEKLQEKYKKLEEKYKNLRKEKEEIEEKYNNLHETLFQKESFRNEKGLLRKLDEAVEKLEEESENN